MKILTVIGTRPQFVKASVVTREIAKHPDLQEIIINTGQHYDNNMSDVFFTELEIPLPKYNLSVGSGSHAQQTATMLVGIEEILSQEKPDILLIYGDTNSTLAAALAAAKLHIPIAHIEAGLRSFNKKMPEEINRIMADHLSTYLFAPTKTAVSNLKNEGFSADQIKQVGDVMYDVALFFSEKSQAQSKIIESLNLTKKNYILATIHRAENTDDIERLTTIIESFLCMGEEMQIVLPLHPRTRKNLSEVKLLDEVQENLICIEPVGFLDMIQLEKHAALVATDSGGVQKEAYFHGTPCVTLRDETEWVELVELGWNHIAAPTSVTSVLETISHALNHTPSNTENPYGNGNSAELIIRNIKNY